MVYSSHVHNSKAITNIVNPLAQTAYCLKTCLSMNKSLINWRIKCELEQSEALVAIVYPKDKRSQKEKQEEK